MLFLAVSYENKHEFEIAREGLRMCGYEFLKVVKTREAHENSINRYCETNDLIQVNINSPRLLFSTSRHRTDKVVSKTVSFLDLYTQEIKDRLINNLKDEKDN